ncbi:hypothetical protein GCM10009827_115230 [Dactylosporangium maewongense]|uniref:Uncharacterized protein n=1 Tax=Dactylosporangium maewongense TaxID=634393 RepID=A0ABN2DBS2_9ACTN
MPHTQHRPAPVGATVVYHGSATEYTGRHLTITNVDTTGRDRYELSDDTGPLLRNVHAASFTLDHWTARLHAIARAAKATSEADLINPYLAEVRTLIIQGSQRRAHDAARALEFHLGLRTATRTGPGAHRR